MNIMILGSGGREHAFAYKIKQSSLCKNIYVAPGNSATSEIATNLEIQVNQFELIADAIQKYMISMVIVGPEVPLVNGLNDYIKSHKKLSNVIVIGPNQHASQLEGSKDFAKGFIEVDFVLAVQLSVSLELRSLTYISIPDADRFSNSSKFENLIVSIFEKLILFP